MNRGRPRHNDVLTPREWEVLDLIREGLTNEEIAERLGVAHNTVKYHVSEILSKLEVESRQEAARWQGRPKVAFGFTPVLALLGKLSGVSKLKLAGAGVLGAAGVALVLLALGVLMGNGGTDLGKIAFVRDGNIWVQELPDGEPYQLTHKDNASVLRWSPSGDWLRYTTNSVRDGQRYLEQYVVRADGTEERMLNSQSPVGYWMPNEDDRIFYYAADGSTLAENADGSDRRRLDLPFASREEGVRRFRLYTGADEDVITYIEVRYPPGAGPDDAATATYYGVWTSNLDGSDARPLVQGNPRDSGQPAPLGWSFGGEYLYFGVWPASDATEEYDAVVERGFLLQAVPTAGGEPKDLFTVNIFSHSVSPAPSGTVAVAGGERGSWTDKRIALIAPDVSTVTYLTDSTVAAVSPAWSPAGAQIAYAAAPDTGPDGRSAGLLARRLWLMNPDGSNKRQITAGDGFRDEKPMWSNDGKYILFPRLRPEVYCDGDKYELMLYSVEDGSVRQVNDNLAMSDWVPSDDPNASSLCETNSTPFQRDQEGTPNLLQYFDWWQPGNNR